MIYPYPNQVEELRFTPLREPEFVVLQTGAEVPVWRYGDQVYSIAYRHGLLRADEKELLLAHYAEHRDSAWSFVDLAYREWTVHYAAVPVVQHLTGPWWTMSILLRGKQVGTLAPVDKLRVWVQGWPLDVPIPPYPDPIMFEDEMGRFVWAQFDGVGFFSTEAEARDFVFAQTHDDGVEGLIFQEEESPFEWVAGIYSLEYSASVEAAMIVLHKHRGGWESFLEGELTESIPGRQGRRFDAVKVEPTSQSLTYDPLHTMLTDFLLLSEDHRGFIYRWPFSDFKLERYRLVEVMP